MKEDQWRKKKKKKEKETKRSARSETAAKFGPMQQEAWSATVEIGGREVGLRV